MYVVQANVNVTVIDVEGMFAQLCITSTRTFKLLNTNSIAIN